ncbi:hypothetical protein LEAN103870_14595 [Legionella anisa]|uniref:DrrA phosphatidylinositol 4-phosphate binding domain-containing protein n=1 Tax=Legionella anisa TaxID=28082 RepID=A0AAX0WUE9_9GAMM|nr:hypothetical protein [Legionella anisa]AWN74170.1 hypothetical protein DLD14_10115 [Legionella anisa]KTC71454.1 hypothetical protein Lani_1802 [Legionella anisa]MBN5935196.1 hypothetical protein [Legionella anisa]MCW8425801.1 hypothetical protein [Legionella anisa]MCW8448768.1 hypothetical protein [Legionella anisa]
MSIFKFEAKRSKLKRKEISHILGLKDNPFDTAFKNEGWYVENAQESIKSRYKNLTNGRPVAFNPIKSQSQNQFARKIKDLSIGDYSGFATRWHKHAFTLHVMKDQNGTHFVYTNRGERHLGPGSNATVRVFSVPDADLERFSKDIWTAFTSENRDVVSKFIEDNKSYSTAPSKLQKSNQKVGNCSIANSNIAWHFQLASDYLKKNPGKTYEEALIATKEGYRELRKQDRIEAFKDLLALQTNANYSQDAHMNDVLQALGKLNRKSAHGPNYIQMLLQDPEVNTKLTRMLAQPDFKHHLDNFLGEIKGFTHREGIRKKMEVMRDNILGASFAKLPISEQEKLIKQDPSLQKYSAHFKNFATKEQLARLLGEFDTGTSPKWSPIIQDGIGWIGIDNTPNHKPGIVTRNHKIELNDNGGFIVRNKPSYQINTNLEECEKIINGVLRRIPQDVIIPKLKSIPSPSVPTALPFLPTNHQQVAQLLKEIKGKDSFSWKELADDKFGRIGIDYVPPYAPGIITRDHKIELRDDGTLKVLNKYHNENGISYEENTDNPQEIIASILKRIPQEAVVSLLNSTPKLNPISPKPTSSTALDPTKVELVSRLINHYATGNWKEYADDIEFGIGFKSKLPSMAFHNYQLMITADPNKPIIILDKAQNNKPVNDALRGQILDAILQDVEIQRLQTAVPSVADKAKIERITRLINHYANGAWETFADNIEFGIGKKSNLRTLVFDHYQLMVPKDPNKPLIVLDKAQGYKAIDEVQQGAILDEILKNANIMQLESAMLPELDKVKAEQITQLINRYAIGDWQKFSDNIEFGIGKKSNLRTLVFDRYQLMVPTDPSKPLILLDKLQGNKPVD